MGRRKKENGIVTIIKWAVVICVLVIAAKKLLPGVLSVNTDLTDVANLDKEKLQQKLGLQFTPNQDLKSRIPVFTDGEVTIESDVANGNEIALIYIDGKQVGIFTDSSKYSMFNVHIGDAIIGVEDDLAFECEEMAELITDETGVSVSSVYFYLGKKGQCLAVISNNYSNRVVAMAYYPDFSKAGEQLSSLW